MISPEELRAMKTRLATTKVLLNIKDGTSTTALCLIDHERLISEVEQLQKEIRYWVSVSFGRLLVSQGRKFSGT